jgi:hypothetical protein
LLHTIRISFWIFQPSYNVCLGLFCRSSSRSLSPESTLNLNNCLKFPSLSSLVNSVLVSFWLISGLFSRFLIYHKIEQFYLWRECIFYYFIFLLSIHYLFVIPQSPLYCFSQQQNGHICTSMSYGN